MGPASSHGLDGVGVNDLAESNGFLPHLRQSTRPEREQLAKFDAALAKELHGRCGTLCRIGDAGNGIHDLFELLLRSRRLQFLKHNAEGLKLLLSLLVERGGTNVDRQLLNLLGERLNAHASVGRCSGVRLQRFDAHPCAVGHIIQRVKLLANAKGEPGNASHGPRYSAA